MYLGKSILGKMERGLRLSRAMTYSMDTQGQADRKCHHDGGQHTQQPDWSKFIQNTTFHGVRFIFQHESNCCRKWVIKYSNGPSSYIVNELMYSGLLFS